MRRSLNLVIVLVLTCVIASLSLALVNRLTAGRIAEQKRLEKFSSIRKVLPPFDNDPVEEKKEIGGKTFYIGKKEGKVIGVALETKGEGYGGYIRAIVGIDPAGEITGVEILEHLETPGLGSRIAEDGFRGQFRGKSLANSKLVEGCLAVKKDKGDIDALTGATISCRGVTEAASEALHLFQEYKEDILGEIK